MVWTLILNYSISMPIWDEELEQEQAVTKTTPKQRLLGWIQNKIPQMTITNFTNNWEDGKVLGALVDNCAPGIKTYCIFNVLYILINTFSRLLKMSIS